MAKMQLNYICHENISFLVYFFNIAGFKKIRVKHAFLHIRNTPLVFEICYNKLKIKNLLFKLFKGKKSEFFIFRVHFQIHSIH